MNIGLWKATSEKGTEYFRGVKSGIEINGKFYKVSAFMNTSKKSDKSPDMSVVLTEIQENNQKSIQVPQNTKTEYKEKDIKLTDEEIDKAFSNNDLELPF